MTKNFFKRPVIDVPVVMSVTAIAIALTSLEGSIVAGIAASIPGPFHLATETTVENGLPSKTKIARAPTGCPLRSAPPQWKVDGLFEPPADPHPRPPTAALED
ncbi:hypothetical protein RAD16_04785 [Bradyrhizobium sp. 18BD]